MVATKSVPSQPETSRMASPPMTSTQSHMPLAIAITPSFTAEAPEAGPFSMVSAIAGRMFSASTTALAAPETRLTMPAPMEPTNTCSMTFLRPVFAPASSMASRAASQSISRNEPFVLPNFVWPTPTIPTCLIAFFLSSYTRLSVHSAPRPASSSVRR